MEDTSRAIIEKITKRYPTPVVLDSGHKSSLFFDCVQLSPNDLARLAAEATGHLDQDDFDIALGIAYEGIFFAAAVAGGRQVAILRQDKTISGPKLDGKKVLIVSDVVCSGIQLIEAEKIVLREGGNVVGFACIVDRSQGTNSPIKPLYSAVQAPLS